MKSKIMKHLFSMDNNSKGVPGIMLYIVLIALVYAIVTNIP